MQLNCMDYLVDRYFNLNTVKFKMTYISEKEYPTVLDLVFFVAKYNYFIGAGFPDLKLKISASIEDAPFLIITKSGNIDHAVIYNKGELIDIAGRNLEYYKDKIIGIYPITKVN